MRTSHYRGRVAVITGAGSGIGRALALQLARHGCHLALSDINVEGLRATVRAIDGGAIRVTSHPLDVSERAAVQEYARTLAEEFGAIDLLFNNAGIAGRHARLQEHCYADFERILGVNLWGTIHCTQELLPLLLQSARPQIVNFSSVFGLVAPVGGGAYCTSKFAVRGYTESLQREFAGTHLSVSCLHPGLIATNIAAAADASPDIVERFRRHGMSPERCAGIILGKVARRRRRILITPLARVLDYLQRLSPSASYHLAGPILRDD